MKTPINELSFYYNKLATKIADVQGLSLNEKQLDKISKDPRFQEGVADFIKENSGIDL